jgi:hypothetical protein
VAFEDVEVTAEAGEFTRHVLSETVLPEDETGVTDFAVRHLGTRSAA